MEVNISLKRVRKRAKVLQDSNSIYLQIGEGERLNGPFANVIDGIVNHDRALEFIGDHTVEVMHPKVLESLVGKDVEVIWDNLKKDYYKVSEHLVIFPVEGKDF
jgi:hypothetical protein